jgi:hypothetical protein
MREKRKDRERKRLRPLIRVTALPEFPAQDAVIADSTSFKNTEAEIIMQSNGLLT